jgi:hypothetical protein
MLCYTTRYIRVGAGVGAGVAGAAVGAGVAGVGAGTTFGAGAGVNCCPEHATYAPPPGSTGTFTSVLVKKSAGFTIH